MHAPVALLAGVAMDAAFGDPPNAAHPVAWFGRTAAALDRVAPRTRLAGVLAAAGLVAGSAVAARCLERLIGRTAAGTLVVWTATSRRTLLARAAEVADALDAGDLPGARRLLAYHLVSRDTSALDASEVAGATIESVAENLPDGVIAPWCWHLLAGGPGAVAYRALNTLDGMWGYRDERYEIFGWAAARGDDLANLVPARLAALALILASGRDAPRAAVAWRRDRELTDSPNAGHPMAAVAGALGIVLRKHDQYALNEGARDPGASDIRRAIALADRASLLALTGLTVLTMTGARR